VLLQILAYIYLGLAALMFLGFGAILLFAPKKLERWVGVTATTPQGLTELRAFYGGLEIGLGLFCIACLDKPMWFQAGLAGAGWACAGLAFGRLVGWFMDRSRNRQQVVYWLVELCFGACGISLSVA
jgi:hypothetical protein